MVTVSCMFHIFTMSIMSNIHTRSLTQNTRKELSPLPAVSSALLRVFSTTGGGEKATHDMGNIVQ